MWRSRLVFAGLMLSVVGWGAATFALLDTESRIAVPLLGILDLLIVVWVARAHARQRDAVFLGGIMLIGLGGRFLLMALIHQSVGPYVFAPDAYTYEGFGQQLANYWLFGSAPPSRLQDTIQVGYYYLNAALYVVFGNAVVAPAVLNALMGVLVAIPVFHTVRAILPRGEYAARVAAVLAVFFPSLVLWSVLNIREAPAVLTVAATVYFFVRAAREFRPRYVAGVVVSLALLALLREYLVVLVALGGIAGAVMSLSRRPARAFAAGGIMLAVLIVSFRALGLGGTLVVEPDLERVTDLREAMTARAGSAIETSIDTRSPGGAIRFLPIGFTRFMFGPYPWVIGGGSLLQALTLPEVLIWYILIPSFLRGLSLSFKNDPRSYTVLAAVFLSVSVAYSLVEGNLGTAYRHRAQVMPIAFVFVAVGFQDWWAVRMARARQAAQSLRKARPVGARRVSL